MPIKNLASVGGGFFGANSAHPYENPDAWTNIVTCIGILLLPCALVVVIGEMLGRGRHAAVMYGVMLFLLVGHDRLDGLPGHDAAESGTWPRNRPEP